MDLDTMIALMAAAVYKESSADSPADARQRAIETAYRIWQDVIRVPGPAGHGGGE